MPPALLWADSLVVYRLVCRVVCGVVYDTLPPCVSRLAYKLPSLLPNLCALRCSIVNNDNKYCSVICPQQMGNRYAGGLGASFKKGLPSSLTAKVSSLCNFSLHRSERNGKNILWAGGTFFIVANTLLLCSSGV